METKKKLREDITALRNELNVLKWEINNPPKFKYGDRVHVHREFSGGIEEYDAIVLNSGTIEVWYEFIYRKYAVNIPPKKNMSYEDESHMRLISD